MGSRGPGPLCGLAPRPQDGPQGRRWGAGSIPTLGAVSGLGTKAASWLDLPRGTGERRTERGRRGR